MTKLRVGVLFGGRSGEHEVSLMSAKSIISALNPEKYDVIPIGITKEGKWRVAKDALELIQRGELPTASPEGSDSQVEVVDIVPDPTVRQELDVVFPVLHGTYGEDGTVQGLLDLANIPYVGAGVAASAVSMDKAMMRALFRDAGLPLVPWEVVLRSEWRQEPNAILGRVVENLGYPCFVKPANLGSSVGISKARNREALAQALELASAYDRKLVVEKAVPNAREIECSVLGNDKPMCSVPGEIIPGNEFYDYHAKYLADNSKLLIPADLGEPQKWAIQEYAVRAYKAVDCSGMARIDFFIDQHEQVLVNEINTIPGFTRISMYPKLWEASGVSFSQLVDTLIDLALERHCDRGQTRTNR